MIFFLTLIFKQLKRQSIYWDLEDTSAEERVLGYLVAYCHVSRDTNCIADNMARQPIEA